MSETLINLVRESIHSKTNYNQWLRLLNEKVKIPDGHLMDYVEWFISPSESRQITKSTWEIILKEWKTSADLPTEVTLRITSSKPIAEDVVQNVIDLTNTKNNDAFTHAVKQVMHSLDFHSLEDRIPPLRRKFEETAFIPRALWPSASDPQGVLLQYTAGQEKKILLPFQPSTRGRNVDYIFMNGGRTVYVADQAALHVDSILAPVIAPITGLFNIFEKPFLELLYRLRKDHVAVMERADKRVLLFSVDLLLLIYMGSLQQESLSLLDPYFEVAEQSISIIKEDKKKPTSVLYFIYLSYIVWQEACLQVKLKPSFHPSLDEHERIMDAQRFIMEHILSVFYVAKEMDEHVSSLMDSFKTVPARKVNILPLWNTVGGWDISISGSTKDWYVANNPFSNAEGNPIPMHARMVNGTLKDTALIKIIQAFELQPPLSLDGRTTMDFSTRLTPITLNGSEEEFAYLFYKPDKNEIWIAGDAFCKFHTYRLFYSDARLTPPPEPLRPVVEKSELNALEQRISELTKALEEEKTLSTTIQKDLEQVKIEMAQVLKSKTDDFEESKAFKQLRHEMHMRNADTRTLERNVKILEGEKESMQQIMKAIQEELKQLKTTPVVAQQVVDTVKDIEETEILAQQMDETPTSEIHLPLREASVFMQELTKVMLREVWNLIRFTLREGVRSVEPFASDTVVVLREGVRWVESSASDTMVVLEQSLEFVRWMTHTNREMMTLSFSKIYSPEAVERLQTLYTYVIQSFRFTSNESEDDSSWIARPDTSVIRPTVSYIFQTIGGIEFRSWINTLYNGMHEIFRFTLNAPREIPYSSITRTGTSLVVAGTKKTITSLPKLWPLFKDLLGGAVNMFHVFYQYMSMVYQYVLPERPVTERRYAETGESSVLQDQLANQTRTKDDLKNGQE